MKKSALALIISLLILAGAITWVPRDIDNEAALFSPPSSEGAIVETETSRSTITLPVYAPTVSQPDLVQGEIESRLADNQSDEVTVLGGQLARYNDLSQTEKTDLLTAYATFFLRNSQYDDARFFYEQILLLPDLDQTNRLAILQMLTRIAIASEDWNGFLAYNDQYFSEGGDYNWIVTGNLLNAYQRIGNFDAAGQALLLHLENGLNPNFDGSEQQYQRYYGTAQDIPLRVSNPVDAVEIARGMVDQFDRPENWKVLSEVYQKSGDQANLNQVIETAKARGFLDNSGNWLVTGVSQ